MKVLLADPPRLESQYDAAYPNLGILYLIANGRRRLADRDVTLHYLESCHTLKSHIEAIEQMEPDVYGISYASFTSPLAHKTVAAVRERFPTLPIIAGGAHPTAAWDSVLRETPVDVCVLGEGETTFCEVVEHFAGSGKPLEEIAGVAIRRNGEPWRTVKRDLILNLDDIAEPAWDLVDFRNYTGMHLKLADPQSYVVVSRGCPFDCWFCSNPVWKENKPWTRLRSAQAIADEVAHLYSRGVREVYLSADEFNLNYEWPLEVARALQGLDHPDLHFQCNVRADKVTQDLARELKKMNLWMVHLGIESGNQRTLDGLQKRIRLEQVIDACRIFQETGIKVFGFMMLYHAWEEDGELAFESAADVENTLLFCRRLLKEKLIDYMSWQVATPYPGSRLWATASRFGLLLEPNVFGNTRRKAMNLPGVTEQEVRASLRKGYILKNWYALKSGNIGWRHLARMRENLAVILNQDWILRKL